MRKFIVSFISLAVLMIASQSDAYLSRNEFFDGLVYSDLEAYVNDYGWGNVRGVILNRTKDTFSLTAEIRFFDIRHNLVANAYIWDLKVPSKDRVPFCVSLHSGTVAAAQEAYKVEWVEVVSFECKNVTYENTSTGSEFIGEITNVSGQNFSLANFTLSVYSANNKLIDVLHFRIKNFGNGMTKSFHALSTKKLPPNTRFKIQFDSGF